MTHTIYAILISFLSFLPGMLGVATTIIGMGVGGSPGAIIYDLGVKRENVVIKHFGFLLCTLGQTFVIGAFTSLLVGILWWFSSTKPDIPTWPLYLVAFGLTSSVAGIAEREQPEKPNAQHFCLHLTWKLSLILFFLIVLLPNAMTAVYGWVPFYEDPGQ